MPTILVRIEKEIIVSMPTNLQNKNLLLHNHVVESNKHAPVQKESIKLSLHTWHISGWRE
ncbi:MAG: hypothetical protein ABI358_10725 [Ginsengibacter sp.]